MRKSLVFGIIVATCLPAFSATTYKETWDNHDLEGWSGNTGWTKVEVRNDGAGDNPSGYLFTERGDYATAGAVTEKDEFTGSYGTASEVSISFDLNVMDDTGLRLVYLRLRYLDPRYNGWIYLLPKAPETNQWITHTVSFNPAWSDGEAESAGWVQEESRASFSETMANIYTVEVRLAGLGFSEGGISAGIDNFELVLGDPDEDNDGVNDDNDECPGTQEGAIVDESGCSIDQHCPCDGDWKNHGQFVSQVAHIAKTFLEDGLISEEEKDAIVSEAAQSDCGKKKKAEKTK